MSEPVRPAGRGPLGRQSAQRAVPSPHAEFLPTRDAPRSFGGGAASQDHLRLWNRGRSEIEGAESETAEGRRTAAGTTPSIPATKHLQLAARGIAKSYYKGQYEIPVLRGVDLDVYAGEFLSIVGQSGCGKSTLLHVLGTLDAPDKGELFLSDVRIDHLPAKRRDLLRNRYFGMIFQFYHLLPELTTLENVLAPTMIGRGIFAYLAARRRLIDRARELLDMVGLSHRLKHRPSELSGGEMQRTAIARALINEPEVLLADEPTGNLDHNTGGEILEILRTLNRDRQLTIVMVTHDDAIANEADRTVRLSAGLVERIR